MDQGASEPEPARFAAALALAHIDIANDDLLTEPLSETEALFNARASRLPLCARKARAMFAGSFRLLPFLWFNRDPAESFILFEDNRIGGHNLES